MADCNVAETSVNHVYSVHSSETWSNPEDQVKNVLHENTPSIWPGVVNKVESNIGPKTTHQNFVMIYNNTFNSNLHQFTNTSDGLNFYNPLNTLSNSTVTNLGMRINSMHTPAQHYISGNNCDQTNITNNKMLLLPLRSTKIGTVNLNINEEIKSRINESIPELPKLNCIKEPSSTSNIGEPNPADLTATNKLNKVVETESEFFCSACHIDCGSIELLLEHKEKKPFVCRVCTRSFKTHLDLESHFITHPAVRCKHCSKVFHSRKDFNHHRKSSNLCNDRFECNICHKTFSSCKTMRNHRLSHTAKKSNSDETYNCVVCDRSLKNPKLLHYHLVSTHSAFENVECETCNKVFSGPDKLKFHIKSAHIDGDGNIPIRCTLCDKVYKNKMSLQMHMMTHDDQVRKCEICGDSIKNIRTLKWHMLKEHPQTGKFVCEICNQHFNKKMLLLMHKKSHSKRSVTSPVFCEICGKQYKSKDILKRHKLIHLDEKPFKCEICGATFKQKVALRTHGRIHSDVPKYKCNHCGMTFKWKQTFDKHLKKCEIAITENDDSTE